LLRCASIMAIAAGRGLISIKRRAVDNGTQF
jgi:hypothetical protein